MGFVLLTLTFVNYFMHTLEVGYDYELVNFDNNKSSQRLKFIHKIPDVSDQTKLVTKEDGTTNEEVLEVLIHRLKFLYQKLPDILTQEALACCEDALRALHERTQARRKRGIEGTLVP